MPDIMFFQPVQQFMLKAGYQVTTYTTNKTLHGTAQ